MNNKLIEIIENSFLKPLLNDEDITDISYNGISIFYMHTIKGRQKSDIVVTNNEVLDFIRQVANYAEKQFSYSIPILDVSVGKYRINSVHPSIVRVGDEKSCSFAIRIGSTESRIKKGSAFLPQKAEELLINCLNNEESIVIAGPTGSGKTELQKYLLSKLRKNSRVVVIDNIQELENLRQFDDLDITSWQISSNNPNGSMQELIRNALRSNPDWLVIAESRGSEMNEVLNSVLTGHPIVTTLHADSLEDIPRRIARMVEMANINQKHEDVLQDISHSMRNYVFVDRKINNDGSVERYVESIGKLEPNLNFKILYKKGMQI